MAEEEKKSYSEQQEEMARNSEAILRSLIKAYKSLKTIHERFCRETEDSCMDFAGPELQTAMQLSLHKRLRFTLAIEDLVHEDSRHGGLDRITPKQPKTEDSTSEKEQASTKLKNLTSGDAKQETAGETEALETEEEQPKEDLGDGSN